MATGLNILLYQCWYWVFNVLAVVFVGTVLCKRNEYCYVMLIDLTSPFDVPLLRTSSRPLVLASSDIRVSLPFSYNMG